VNAGHPVSGFLPLERGFPGHLERMVSRCVASSSAVFISGDGERRVDSADRSIDWLYFVVIQSLVSADRSIVYMFRSM
jgi:hypothetical protein